MNVTVHFYSYFQDLTGCAQATENVAAGSTIVAEADAVVAAADRANIFFTGVDEVPAR